MRPAHDIDRLQLTKKAFLIYKNVQGPSLLADLSAAYREQKEDSEDLERAKFSAS
ncbi:hypothetical protein HS1genome_0467 [Sulfodiicoccus acidiphilus]|uniref:Uncharacterized protein n=1 Tax=Sulfodiicoccus acidiphilus TaxID=1670455 RepID=A0A348B1M6_9CREN|nr:hypothetical protein HS1genome_0467 [Sulfodiicoccus acidiphilus]GGU05554.1 hypothetical protein GCM10007116_22410 [Sulfodiicoccus acidiphilus]